MAALKATRLPDVAITEVSHYESYEGPEYTPFIGPSWRIAVGHTRVTGTIGGKIGFEVLLPDEWNGRFVMGGGGGFVGTIENQAREATNRGYATAGTDTGHKGAAVDDGLWALNDAEAQLNFSGLAVHRTAATAKALIHAYYGANPEFSFFSGCSTGGGQALIEAQRYPDDFDGIIAAAPVVNNVALAGARIHNAQHFFPNPEKLNQPIVSESQLQDLTDRVVQQCDRLDGVADGIIDYPLDCDFDLQSVPELTPAQTRALKALYEGPSVNGESIYPGMPFGSEHGFHTWKAGSFPDLVTSLGMPNYGIALGLGYARSFIFQNPAWDYSTYDWSTWHGDTRFVNAFSRADDPNLEPFRDRGGKLILWHGWHDAPLTPLASIRYYETVQRRDRNLRDYFRFFLLPGVDHCSGGPGPDQVEWLSLIEDWVKHGQAPNRVVARKLDDAGSVSRSRPVYPYPLRAVYSGTGSVDDADSYVLASDH